MELVKFVNQLRETGHIRLSADPSPSVPANKAAQLLSPYLKELDHADRLASPPGLPPLSLGPGAWAMTRLYEAACCLVFRELDEAAVRRRLSAPCPQSASPSTAYSVDLAFRHLPELLDLARGLSEDDCLVTCLRALARNWPLSSVGVPRLGPVECDSFIGNDALKQIYVDRIIETRDFSRLTDPVVAEALRASVGAVGNELCPEVMAALDLPNSPDLIDTALRQSARNQAPA